MMREYTLYGILVLVIGNHAHTHSFKPIGNFSIENPPGIILGGGSNPENSEETYVGKETRCKSQAGCVRR